MAIEGPELKDVDFNEILEIFKLKNRRLLFNWEKLVREGA